MYLIENLSQSCFQVVSFAQLQYFISSRYNVLLEATEELIERDSSNASLGIYKLPLAD